MIRSMAAAAILLSATLLSPGASGQPSLAVPTPEQAAWQDLAVGMFVHFATGSCSEDRTKTMARSGPGSVSQSAVVSLPLRSCLATSTDSDSDSNPDNR